MDCNRDAIAGFAASGWFGDVLIQSQESPAHSDELAVTAGLARTPGMITAKHPKHTKRNPPIRGISSHKPTEGNEGNKVE
jgi:hypothetical protein